ncbi:hypothetical protein N9N67_10070 [Bacteriovoracaceae bacterium]|nr:hypothetical protein [Bacteriovoracaceae bacterium]
MKINTNIIKYILAYALVIMSGLIFAQKKPVPINIDNELGLIINYRCERYLSGSESSLCKESVQTMISELNVKYVNDGNIPWSGDLKPVAFIAFHDELIKLLSQSTTGNYLSHLKNKFSNYTKDQSPLNFNLFQETVNYFTSEKVALKNIALLFQDTSEVKAHVYYLRNVVKKKSSMFEENLNQLDQILDIFNHIFTYNRDVNLKAFFPQNFTQANDFSSIYHFYVPAYLSTKLAQNLSTKNGRARAERGAFLSTFMFVLTYEMVTSGEKISKKYLVNDPPNIRGNMVKIKDLFTTFNSAYFHSTKSMPQKSLVKLKGLLEKKTSLGVNYLLSK